MKILSVSTENSKWIRFQEIPDIKRKTKIFEVRTKDDSIVLGEVKWFGRWRCYSFFPAPNTVFEQQCLGDITHFIAYLMMQRTIDKQISKNI